MAKNALTADLEPEVPEEEIAAADEQPAEEAPVVEEKVEKPAAEKPVEEKEKFVPHAALHEERELRKELKAEVERLRQSLAVQNDRFQQLWQVVQPQQQAPQFRDPKSDPDPMEALAHNQAILAQQAQEAAQHRQQNEQRNQMQEHARRLTGWASAKAQEYAQENPDFPEAYKHIRMVRAQELQAMGYQGQELAERLYNEELGIFHEAAQRGLNPAEIAFNMARAAGWKPAPKEQAKPTAEEKIETLQKGAQAAKTLGSGGAPSGMPTPEQIAAMGEEEFEELKAKLRSKGKRLSDIIGG